MSKKPNQQLDRRVDNTSLLPEVFQTVPNKKMIGSTLDLVTSKGQMLPFNNTFGTRSAADSDIDFLVKETDPTRAESQTNIAFVSHNSDNTYTGKTAYLDIDNYFKIKGLPLQYRSQLDKDALDLDLPISLREFTEYNQYYWLPFGIITIKLNYEPDSNGNIVLDVTNNIIGKHFIELVNQETNQRLPLMTGMQLIFTGDGVEEAYRTTNLEKPKIFYVSGNGFSVDLIDISAYDNRIPQSTSQAVGWDVDSDEFPSLNGWGGSVTDPSWDISIPGGLDPEYIVVERFNKSHSHWSIINRWYDVNLIRVIADYLSIPIDTIAKNEYKAVRPIIMFMGDLQLENWPDVINIVNYQFKSVMFDTDPSNFGTGMSENEYIDKEISDILLQRENSGHSNGDILQFPQRNDELYILTFTNTAATYRTITHSDIHGVLPYLPSYYSNINDVVDIYGFRVLENDIVIFNGVDDAQDLNIYQIKFDSNGYPSFVVLASGVEGSCILYTSKSPALNYRFIVKNNKWILAQNKTTMNQAPLFKAYSVDGVDIQTLLGDGYPGFKILDFEDGEIYDDVLQRYVNVVDIDYGIANKIEQKNISGNQLMFVSEIDSDINFIDDVTLEEKTASGPFLYNSNGLKSFWRRRTGLDISPEIYDMTYKLNEYTGDWKAAIPNISEKFNEIHVFNGENSLIKLYFKLSDRGYVRFSSISSLYDFECIIPLMAGEINKIICHNLKYPITFFVNSITPGHLTSTLKNITTPISNGVITLDLSDVSDMTNYVWSHADTYNVAPVRDRFKWRFLNNIYLRDKTNPIFNNYEFTIDDSYSLSGLLDTSNKLLVGTSLLDSKAKSGDKILVETLSKVTNKKTAPISLTNNPLNSDISRLSYYNLYQHSTSTKQSIYTREFRDPLFIKDNNNILQAINLGNSTINKHNNPLAKLAIMSSQLPVDVVEIFFSQGRHYDLFMNRFIDELRSVNITTEETSPYNIIDLTLRNLYANRDLEDFWYHSNMIGWGDEYSDTPIIADQYYQLEEPIDFRSGKETLLHIIDANGRMLMRDIDYSLQSDQDGFYTKIYFPVAQRGKTFNVRIWPTSFASRIPASLAKIGLAPVYRPEIYLDDPDNNIYLIRHDGTKYHLVNGIDATGYPIDIIDGLLYEYEKAVWSSISYDIEHNLFIECIQDLPGGFRGSIYPWNEARSIVNSRLVKWANDNNYFISKSNFDGSPFTVKYKLSINSDTIIGSWRVIYKYFYDTDRPHTHPWEMMGHTVKPTWWDENYSWIDPIKRVNLENALRSGLISKPSDNVYNPRFSRVIDVENPEAFPVDSNGNLLSPLDLDWLESYLDISMRADDWVPGEYGDKDSIFLNTHCGLASEISMMYLLSPTRYVTNNWVPGSYVYKNNLKLSKNNLKFITPNVDLATSHRSTVDGITLYTAGIESLITEFCILNNINFSEVFDKFNNVKLKKEILLGGFTHKDNIRIKSASVKNHTKNIFVPAESYDVHNVKHYTHLEIFYSGIRIVWNGSVWNVFGFTNENPYFSYYMPKEKSPTIPIRIENVVINQKSSYDTGVVHTMMYGTQFSNRQEIYDFIIGYGKWLESHGFVFDEPEGGDIRDWQLSGKQFIVWSNSYLAAGNYIDLNPAAYEIKFTNHNGQFDNLSGNNLNPGLCVDRNYRPMFSKDLLINRGVDVTIKTKDNARSIYGIKLSFSNYETVIHLNNVSNFGDVYFDPIHGITRRGYQIGGKKTDGWTGEYFAPGYMFTDDSMIPNYDSMSEVGNDLLNFETAINDPLLIEASRAQFGLNRNAELSSLFITEDSESQFKSIVAFSKGTQAAFTSLIPLTHTSSDSGITTPNEEYMIKLGEMGNTKNIEFYEFELPRSKIRSSLQVVKFSDDSSNDPNSIFIKNEHWVYRPYENNNDKTLSFNTEQLGDTSLSITNAIVAGDTDYSVNTLRDVGNLFNEFSILQNIQSYDNTKSYKKNDQFRFQGSLYAAIGTIPSYSDLDIASAAVLISDRVVEINEPYLPNIFVKNYVGENPNFTNSDRTPSSWQILQTFDTNLGIDEVCTGLTDASKARVSTYKPHNLRAGDMILIINAENGTSSVNGIWTVDSIDESGSTTGSDNNGSTYFYINTRITSEIYSGKIFIFRPVRFSNLSDLQATVAPNSQLGYDWKKKFNPLTTALGNRNIVPPPTPSGYPSEYPIAIVDESIVGNNDYSIFNINDGVLNLIAEKLSPVDIRDIDHLIIYDHIEGKTIVKLELFDPRSMSIPKVLMDEIDIISRVDPAKYNKTTDQFKAAYMASGWYEEYIGRRWLDLSSLKLSDYTTGSVETRVKQWGKTIDNKAPDIYEWTKSPVPPSQWDDLVKKKKEVFGVVASGQAYVDMYNGIANYHWVEEKDYISGKTYNIYYFWVKNKNTIAIESTLSRVYSTNILSKILLNPTIADIPWWAPVTHNSIVLCGVDKYLNENTVVQIKRTKIDNEGARITGGNKSQQWLLITENDSSKIIPEWMHIRLRDSIGGMQYYEKSTTFLTISDIDWKEGVEYPINSIVRYQNKFYRSLTKTKSSTWNNSKINFHLLTEGVDYTIKEREIVLRTNREVPTKKLHKFNMLGNQIRPYVQTWFGNLFEARRLLIQQANILLSSIDLINNNPLWNRTLTSDTIYSDIWSYTDYVSVDYDPTKSTVAVVQNIKDIFNLTINAGDYIDVVNDNAIYEMESTGGYSVVYRKSGTIKFSETLPNDMYKNLWDSSLWDMISWDDSLIGLYFYKIVEMLRYDMFIKGYENKYNMLMMSMIRYVLSEQRNVDWIQKASTIQPFNLIGSDLDNNDTFQRDTISSLVDFYSSVKSYRDKVRGGVVNKQNIDNTNVEINESLSINEIDLTTLEINKDSGYSRFIDFT